MAAPYGIAVHHGNHGLGQGTYLLLHVEHVEARHAVLPHIAAPALEVHVAAAAEGLVPRAGKRHHADIVHFPAQTQGVAHFRHRHGREGVAPVRPVDGDFPYPVVVFKQDVLVGSDGRPFTLVHDASLA